MLQVLQYHYTDTADFRQLLGDLLLFDDISADETTNGAEQVALYGESRGTDCARDEIKRKPPREQVVFIRLK